MKPEQHFGLELVILNKFHLEDPIPFNDLDIFIHLDVKNKQGASIQFYLIQIFFELWIGILIWIRGSTFNISNNGVIFLSSLFIDKEGEFDLFVRVDGNEMGSVGKVVVEDYEDSNYKISRLNFEDHCLQSLIFSLQCSQLSTNERFKTLEELENEEVDYELESLDEVYQFKHDSTQEILYCQSIFHNYNIKISPYFNQMGSIQFYFSFQKELDEILRSEPTHF